MKTGNKSLFKQVGEFNKKFALPVAGKSSEPHLIPDIVAEYRISFLEEELSELKSAYAANDLVEIADALVDIVYVALGTAHFYGLPFDELFEEVHQSNMTKIRAQHAVESKRNSGLDVIKPNGWRKPDLAIILHKYIRCNTKLKEN